MPAARKTLERVVPLAFTALPTDPEEEVAFRKLQTGQG